MVIFVIAAILLFLAGVAAGDGGAHVHGEAQLRIAAEGDRLYVEFESPLANLVRFEHRPRTPEQRAQLQRAARILAGPDRFLLFEGTGCRLLEAGVEEPYGEGEGARQGGTPASTPVTGSNVIIWPVWTPSKWRSLRASPAFSGSPCSGWLRGGKGSPRSPRATIKCN